MVVSTAKLTVQPEKRTEFFQTIGRLRKDIESTRGCLNFCLYVDPSDESSSLLLGEWETPMDLENYHRSAEFAVLRGAITVLSIQSVEFNALVEVTAAS